jgi:hypothetical protein
MQVSEFQPDTKVDNSTCDYRNIYPAGPMLSSESNDMMKQNTIEMNKNC